MMQPPDPTFVGLATLLMWSRIDPTQSKGAGVDSGYP
jgi:hypothetical protein